MDSKPKEEPGPVEIASLSFLPGGFQVLSQKEGMP